MVSFQTMIAVARQTWDALGAVGAFFPKKKTVERKPFQQNSWLN